MWSMEQDEPLSKILTEMPKGTVASIQAAIVDLPGSYRKRLSSYEVLRLFRQLIRFHSRLPRASDTSCDDDIERCFRLLLEIMAVLEGSDLEEFQMARKAIIQVFCGLPQRSERPLLELEAIIASGSPSCSSNRRICKRTGEILRFR